MGVLVIALGMNYFKNSQPIKASKLTDSDSFAITFADQDYQVGESIPVTVRVQELEKESLEIISSGLELSDATLKELEANKQIQLDNTEDKIVLDFSDISSPTTIVLNFTTMEAGEQSLIVNHNEATISDLTVKVIEADANTKQVRDLVKAVEVPINKKTSDFSTIEQLPFEALNDADDLDGFTRVYQNDPTPFTTKLKDGRTYNFAFGAVYNKRDITDTKPTPVGLATSDHLYQPLPKFGELVSNVKMIHKTYLTHKLAEIPLLGSQVAVEPSLENTQTKQTWATYAFESGLGMGNYGTTYSIALDTATGAHYDQLPQVVKMYKNGAVILAYGLLFDPTTKVIDGYIRVKLEPIGVKGRVKTTTKYINARSQTRKTALAFASHVDVQNRHTDSKLFNIGFNQGAYFKEEAISDNLPYLLKFHTDGYDNQPEAQFGSDQHQYNPWQKVRSSFTSTSLPVLYDEDEEFKLGHPVLAYRWKMKQIAALESVEWSLDQSVTSANSKAPEISKTVKNLTNNNVQNTLVSDKVEYTVLVSNKTPITQGLIKDVLPKEVSKPTGLVLVSSSGGTTPLDVESVYKPETHSIEVPIETLPIGSQTLQYTVTILESARDKIITNTATFNGTDMELDEVAEITATLDLVVKEIPEQALRIKYQDEQETTLADDKVEMIKPGNKYEAMSLDLSAKVDGSWTLVDAASSPAKGTMGTEPLTIIFTYRKGIVKVVTDYYKRGTDGYLSQLVESVEKSYGYHDTYLTENKNDLAATEGYTLESSDTGNLPEGTTGNRDETLTVNYIYKLGQVRVKTLHLKEDGLGAREPLFETVTTDKTYGYHTTYNTEARKDEALKLGYVLATTTGDPITGNTGQEDKTIEVTYVYVKGKLTLTAPNEIDFGTQGLIISGSKDRLPKENIKVSILDELEGKWNLKLNISADVTHTVDGSPIRGNFKFVRKDGTQVPISEDNEIIHSKTAEGTTNPNVNLEWDKTTNKGLIYEQLPGNKKGNYSGQFTWTLEDAL